MNAQFSVNAELRPRFEYLRGYGKLPVDTMTDPAILISQRTRLTFNYAKNGFEAKVTLQDWRYWGDETLFSATGAFGDPASIELFEGYVAVPLFKISKLYIGRQQLVYDDERLLAARNWNQGGISYDAVVWKFKKNSWKIDLAGSWNSDPTYLGGLEYTSAKIRTLNYIWAGKTINDNLTASAIIMSVGKTNPDALKVIYMKETFGANLFANYESFEGQATAYYQAGLNNGGKDVSAYFVAILAYYKGKIGKVGGGVNIISGQKGTSTDDSYNDKDHLFDLFYGARHRYYGYMDYFNNTRNSTAGGGLNDIFLQYFPNIGSKHKMEIAYHYFTNNQEVLDPDAEPGTLTGMDKFLAHELDIVYTYSPFDFLKWDMGFSFLLPSEPFEKIGGYDPGTTSFAYWPWTMLTFKPALFKSE
jgi:hypothetical protein